MKIFDLDKYAALARQVVAEGCVLLKNDHQALPLEAGMNVAVFGRAQFNYYKSGTGSGGMVNTSYVVGIPDGLKKAEGISVNASLENAYTEWLKDHPFDAGQGWAAEPWCQEEMPLTEEFVRETAKESRAAVVVIGRTAGEDKDNSAGEGSYLLTVAEEDMLAKVCDAFTRTIVLLNTGNTIDMKWVAKYNPSAVLYVWQGGQEGGNGVADVLTGKVNPCGKLPDTIAYDIEDYPSTINFGDPEVNVYAEDIYVGYRYFETFAKDKVLYPFGFGLSYTTFSTEASRPFWDGEQVTLDVTVTNTGKTKGKETVQIYLSAPCGKLGKAARVLCDFEKTKLLEPGESQTLHFAFDRYTFASYDDNGASGYAYAYVLEAGEYTVYAGSDVRSAKPAGAFTIANTVVVEQLEQAGAPVTAFQRMKAVEVSGEMEIRYEDAPLRCYDLRERVEARRPKGLPITGDQGIRLRDVAEKRASMEDFVAQLTEEELCTLVRGEGMCSPKVTAGTAAAFGGVTKALSNYGIPVGCCADGPSGIRMDCGTIAFSMPNGVCLASTFDRELSERLYEMEGLELRKNRIETLLGPGINLHRNPLNGRNFEYFSEDPLLTGQMAAAQLRGMHKYDVTGTIKHYACNNQEFKRHEANGIVSERALRELYLKCFEIAVKEGNARSIMSTYGPVNGRWTSTSYDLLTTILRGEWGFQGIVMTDWWAKGNEDGGEGSIREMAAMVRSQNDVYMVTASSEENSNNDNLSEGLKDGRVTVGELQRSAANICRVLVQSPAYLRSIGQKAEVDRQLEECLSEEETYLREMIRVSMDRELLLPVEQIGVKRGDNTAFNVIIKDRGAYRLTLKLRVDAVSKLAQVPVSIFRDNNLVGMISLTGEDSQWREEVIDLGVVELNRNFYLKFYFGQAGMELGEARLELVRSIEDDIRKTRT